MLLEVIVCSTRPGRAGKSVADWFTEQARAHGGFEVELVDLAEVGLPLFDEPRHPRLGDYEHDHTRRWSEIVARADAYVFVTPEYNHGPPPALINALSFVSKEWAYKPVGFASYGFASAGVRGVELVAPIVTALNMMPVPPTVAIPFFTEYLDPATGRFRPGEAQDKACSAMLDELQRWAGALAPLRKG